MGKRLYVGNLPFSTGGDDLRRAFDEFGSVVAADVISDRATGRSRGFGFVEMETDEEAQAAMNQMNGTNFGGRPLTVNEAREQRRDDRRF